MVFELMNYIGKEQFTEVHRTADIKYNINLSQL